MHNNFRDIIILREVKGSLMSLQFFIELSRSLCINKFETNIASLIIDYSKKCLWEFDPNMFVSDSWKHIEYDSWYEFYDQKIKCENPSFPVIISNWIWNKEPDNKNTLSINFYSELATTNLTAVILVQDADEPDIRRFLTRYTKII